MKKSLLLIFLSIFSFATINAAITWNLSDDGTLTISGTDMPRYYLASEVPWYSQRTTIKKIVIEKGVTSIGNYAFYECSALTSVTIPNSVTSIGMGAFAGCSGLISIIIPNSVKKIGQGAFVSCSGLTSITIPNSVTNIEQGALMVCPVLVL